MNPTPLYEAEKERGAQFTEIAGWSVPERYGNPAEEYRAAKTGVGLRDASMTGRLRVSGKSRFDHIQNYSTNDMRNLKPGQGLQNVLTTLKGRIQDFMTIYVFDDHLLILTLPDRPALTRSFLMKHVLFGIQIKIEDVTAETAQLELFGPDARTLLESLGGTSLENLKLNHWVKAQIGGQDVTVARTKPVTGEAFNLIMMKDAALPVWQALMEHGVTPVGEEAYNILRVEAGLPAPVRELSEEYNPLEPALIDAISFKKGCYLGQEVIARLYNYEKVQKELRGIKLPKNAPASIPAGDLLTLAAPERNDAAFVTSIVESPEYGRIGLGYVRLKYAEPGTRLQVPGSSEEAEVTALPFNKQT